MRKQETRFPPVITLAFWLGGGRCPLWEMKVCPDCALFNSMRYLGSTAIPEEVMLAAFKEALAFARAEPRIAWDFIWPGIDFTTSKWLSYFLEALDDARGVFDGVSHGFRVSANTSGVALCTERNWNLLTQRFRNRLDTVRISINTRSVRLHDYHEPPTDTVVKNARKLMLAGGCSRVHIAINFTGTNTQEIIDTIDDLMFLDIRLPMIVLQPHVDMDMKNGVYRAVATIEETKALLRTLAEEFGPSDLQMLDDIDYYEYFLQVEVPPEYFCEIAKRRLRPALANWAPVLTDDGLISHISMRTTNSGSPYIGVFVAGQMISLDDIERPTATGQYGLYEEGLLAQLLAEKTRELLGS